jgi:hypothetical protein
VSTSPVSPEDIRAAAEVHQELGPEYSDAVVAAFLERVDRAVAARVEARLAGMPQAKSAPRDNRRTLLKGMAIGACGGALAAAVAATGLAGGAAFEAHRQVVVQNGVHLLPYLTFNDGQHRVVIQPRP